MSGGRITGALARGAIAVVELYRNMISPYRPPSCRFTPTCSEYAVDALREYGLVRGLGCPWCDWPNVVRGTQVDGIRSRSDVRWHPMPRR